ncbi:MAG: PQQ-dependent dehydrogenase, methanol/ethanol family [Steroidobacteraceae bacterium]
MQHTQRKTSFLVLITAAAAAATALAAAGTVVDNRALANEADGRNWASYGRTFSENHYSPLKQINDGNVGQLKLAWYYDLPPMASVYTAPLAVDGVLYFAVGYSVVHAMDARTGRLLWQYDPHAPEVSGMKLRAGWGIRGIAYWKGRVYTGTHDGRLIALDARTGKLAWSVQTTDPKDARYVTGAPWVFNGKIVIGHGGADFMPVRGYVTCYDAATGRQLWRFYAVPGNPKDGFEDDTMKMAASTWRGDWWRFGGAGGTVWHAFAYDPQFNRLYFGTGNGWPWNSRIRGPGGGDNLFLASIVAVDADTGKYAWHYQVNPSDIWDYDASTDLLQTTLTIDGRQRPVLMQASKGGFFYVVDRENGKLLSAGKFSKATWADSIDLKTGRPLENPGARFEDGQPQVIFPGPVGAHSSQAMSFNPATGLVYIPETELGGIYADPEGDLDEWQPKPNMAVNTGLGRPKNSPVPPPGKSSLVAWNPLTETRAWSIPLTGTVNGSTMTTAGNLVLQGQVTGELTAYAADSGRKLWSFDAQTAVIAQPITYTVGGKQYVTVIAGWRGMGSASGVKPEWEYRLQPRRVLTFALDGKAQLPPAGARTSDFIDDPAFVVDPAKAAIGQSVAATHCPLCHGVGLASGGTAPDLRKSPIALSLELLTGVLHDGTLVPRGMPQFAEFTPQQIEGLQHWIRQRAREGLAAK